MRILLTHWRESAAAWPAVPCLTNLESTTKKMSRQTTGKPRSNAPDAGASPALDRASPEDREGPMRLLILDPSARTLDQIQNALWMWPHKIATADSVKSGVAQCQQLNPAAVFIANDFPDSSYGDALAKLRAQLPHTPIIAITSIPGAANTSETLKRGADAVIRRSELERPTLHNLLMQLREMFRPADTEAPVRQRGLGLPWRNSRMLGCLVCDVNGTVIDANACLAGMLDYSARTDLLGMSMWRDILQSPVDWKGWKSVAGDLGQVVFRSATVRTAGGQARAMLVEVFAAPESPSHLQMTFVAGEPAPPADSAGVPSLADRRKPALRNCQQPGSKKETIKNAHLESHLVE